MTSPAKKSRWRHLRRFFVITLGILLPASAAAILFIWSGAADRAARRAIVHRLEALTGGAVELTRFHFDWWHFRADLHGLTIHGREPAGTPPFFQVKQLLLDIHVDSLFQKKISLQEVILSGTEVHVRVNADGSTNLPSPKSAFPGGMPLRERLFALSVRKVRIEDGVVLFNDVKLPLAAQGGEFSLSLDAGRADGQPIYTGRLTWQQMIFVARRYLPFPSDLSVKFTLEKDAFAIDQLNWRLPHSEVDARASLVSFAKPFWNFRYRGRLDFSDIREILRKPLTPKGRADFSGEGTFGAGRVNVAGHYSAQDIALPYVWFHAGGFSSRGEYHVENRGVQVPDFRAQGLGGTMQGRVAVTFHGLQFRAETQSQDMSLAAIFAALDHDDFPLRRLHWNGAVNAKAVTTWNADFQHIESAGTAEWLSPERLAPGEIPATGRFAYHFVEDNRQVLVNSAEIHTPSTDIVASGLLGLKDSALEATAEVRDLEPWNDFLSAIRGHAAGILPASEHVAGNATWRGRVLGPLDRPTFAGHGKGEGVRYGDLSWDSVEGDVTYSVDKLRIARGHLVRGGTSADIDLTLALDHWSFAPKSMWTLEASLVRAPTDDLQELFHTSYPVHGLLTGQFHGRGTRAAPEFTGLFDLAEGEALGIRFDRFRGQLVLSREEVRFNNAELRAFAPRSGPSHGPGIITGNLRYGLDRQEIAFDLTGAAIPLEGVQNIQTARFPLGGQMNFQISGQGPLLAPTVNGSMRLIDLRVGKDVLGSFEVKLNSDGSRVTAGLTSAMSAGQLTGEVTLGLGRDYPLSGDITIQKIDLDPFIQAALHLEALTGHSSVDGHFQISGALAHPETLAVDANLSRVSFEYEHVRLDNSAPVRIRYMRDELRIEQAALRGTDSDFHLAGSARFTGNRAVKLDIGGTLNLRLASGFLPNLEAAGPADVNASFGGTLDRLRINGKIHVADASARYGDFPAGLTHVNGDFVFDSTRMLFEKVTAESGGGRLEFSGTLQYGEGPLHYDFTAVINRVRLRYPEGMSWLVGGSLRLSGTTQAGLLSGRVTVDRLVLSQGFDFGSVLVAAKEGGPAPVTHSAYLRNLQFDIEAVSGPDARMEWPGAQFAAEASLHARGTWEHPSILGHIHLLSGNITFRGNRYALTRGDVNFSKPFRLDPELNLEATTTIRQYEVTLTFSGSASHLTLAYRSDPPLPSNDIITLLALGRTGEESELRTSTASASQSAGASALLSEAISSQLGGRLERLFGITRLRVDPFLAGTTTEQNSPARVTVEQQVTRDLTVTYITNVTSTQQQVIQVEYNVDRNVSVIALRDENGTFGLDIKIKKRFK
jgi:translocation and assembly module TamB